MARIRVSAPAASIGLPFAGSEPVWHRARPRADRDQLAAIGSQLRRGWAAGAHPADVTLAFQVVLAVASVVSDASLDEAVALVGSHLASLHDLSEQSWARLLAEIARFASYAEATGIASLVDVDELVALEFIEQAVRSRSGAWELPAPATEHVRRNAIRLLYRGARNLGLAEGDPTIDLKLRSRGRANRRPLTDDEEALGRIWSTRQLHDARHPGAWALGQATATNTEIAQATVGDVDLDGGRVFLHGNEAKREPRWGQLTEWGVPMIERQLRELPTDPATPLLSGASKRNGRQSSTNALINDVMAWALLRDEPDLVPSSLPAWAGRMVFERTGRIDDAAHALGIRSLDRAALHIGWQW